MKNIFINTIKKKIIDGILLLLPIGVILFIYYKLYYFLVDFLKPLNLIFIKDSNFLLNTLIILIFIIILLFFGYIAKTKLFKKFHKFLEKKILMHIPGYSIVKRINHGILGDDKQFSRVVLVQIFNNETFVTGFISDESSNGMKTVFVPTGPNPTSGVIYHIKDKYVHPVNISIKDAIHSIVRCGSGSKKIVEQLDLSKIG